MGDIGKITKKVGITTEDAVLAATATGFAATGVKMVADEFDDDGNPVAPANDDASE